MFASISSDINLTFRNSIELLKKIHTESTEVTDDLSDELKDAASVTAGGSGESTDTEESAGESEETVDDLDTGDLDMDSETES